jgi:hypothetical protein
MSDPPARLFAQFIDDVDRAKADLADAIFELFPEQFIEVFPFDEDEEEADDKGRRVVKASDIEDCPSSEIEGAFADFDRTLRRSLRELKEALAKEAADGQ